MYRIIKKEVLAPTLSLNEIQASLVAGKSEVGQFIILRIEEGGGRIPLTIADFDREGGTITCVFQEVGKNTKQLGTLEEGEVIEDFVGLLGLLSHIKDCGSVD